MGHFGLQTLKKKLKFPSYKESHSIHPKHILVLCEGLISPSKDKHKNDDDQKISKRMMNIRWKCPKYRKSFNSPNAILAHCETLFYILAHCGAHLLYKHDRPMSTESF